MPVLDGVALRCAGLEKSFGSVHAVNGVALEVRAGECFGLLGPNGAGKTTTVEMLEGLTAADKGEIEILGLRWGGRDDQALRERLGIQLQQTELADKLTVVEALRLFRSFYRRGRTVDEVIRLLDLESKRTARIGTLSGGQKQRLAVACALVSAPEVLFLDEPTTGLDPQARQHLWEVIDAFKKQGGTVLLTTHYMEEAARLCDRVAIMDLGQVIALGTPAELIASLGADRIIEVETAAALDVAALQQLPGVKGAVQRLARYVLTATHLGQALPAVLAALDQTAIDNLAIHQPTLDDVFIHLTGKALRDGERFSPLLELTLCRLREFYREPGAVFWVFAFPLLLSVGLGIAFRNRPPEKPRIAVPNEAAWVTGLLQHDDSLMVEQVDQAAAAAMLRRGKVDLVVQLADGEERAVVYHYDATRPEGRTARLAVDAALQRRLGRTDVVQSSDTPVDEPGGRYVDFFMPALIGLNLMGSSMWGIGFALVQQRRRKLLKRLAATPMRRVHFLLSFLLSRLMFLVLEVSVMVLFGRFIFGVTVHGSYAALAAMAALGAAAFAGVALLIGGRVESVEAAGGWMNFVMLPMWLLSGSFFSYERFPEVLHPAIRILPLTAINDALRAVFNDGAGFGDLLPQIAVLSAWMLVTMAVALRTFRWQ